MVKYDISGYGYGYVTFIIYNTIFNSTLKRGSSVHNSKNILNSATTELGEKFLGSNFFF